MRGENVCLFLIENESNGDRANDNNGKWSIWCRKNHDL